MKPANGHSNDLAAGSMSASAHLFKRPPHLPKSVGIALVTIAMFFVSSLLLPDDLARIALDLLSWCVVGLLASIALLAVVKVLDDLLDS